MRTDVLLTLLLTLSSVPARAALGADPDAVMRGGPRVRTSDPRVRTAIADGLARSPSFRAVFHRVNALDVIVYVQMEPHLGDDLAGVLMWMARTREFRYVRVALNPALTDHQLIATLAHELQHAAEIGEAPSVVDADTLSAHYQRTGIRSRVDPRRWETAAAKRIGANVRQELADAIDVARPSASEFHQ